jgi:hypothetical protein
VGLFRTSPNPAQLALSTLQAENTDLRQQLRLEREQSEAAKRELVDRILALTNPPALREVRRTPPVGGLLDPAFRHRNHATDSLPPYPPRTPVILPPQTTNG